ncbi:MAG: hypothetical protein MUE81_23705, partial [Thermoflexibacter sp.]|nr:hypothetical protein [Thermoflexibacter sp.]
MKSKSKEEQILAEIRRRVIEFESKNQEEEDVESLRLAHVEALDEMSSLNKEDILRLSYQVRREFELKEAKKKKIILAFVSIAIIISAIVIINVVQKQIAFSKQIIETFDNNQLGWAFFDDLSYERRIENGNYVIQTTQDNWCYWDGVDLNLPSHFAVELTSVWERGEKKGEYGIGLYQDNSNMISFSLYPDGEISHAKSINDKWVVDNTWTGQVGNKAGLENVQRVEIEDSYQFKYFLNGKFVRADTFAGLRLTKVGLRACGSQTVNFKSLKVINMNTNQVILYDDFDTSDKYNWSLEKVMQKESRIENGGYIFRNNTKDFCNWAALPQSYPIKSGADIDIILKMRHINGLTDGFGLMLWQDDSNHYTFEYQNNGKARYNIYENSTYTYVGDFKSTNIISNENSPSVIQKIEIRGSAVKYFVNN